MGYKIEYHKRAQKALRKMPAHVSKKFRANFQLLAEDIERTDLDIKDLSGRGEFRMRVGAYRALFIVQNSVLKISVVKVGSRGDVYK